MPVRLETEQGELVHEGVILPFVTGYPKIVLWGERIFLKHADPEAPGDAAAQEAAHRLGAAAVYRETFYCAVMPKTP